MTIFYLTFKTFVQYKIKCLSQICCLRLVLDANALDFVGHVHFAGVLPSLGWQCLQHADWGHHDCLAHLLRLLEVANRRSLDWYDLVCSGAGRGWLDTTDSYCCGQSRHQDSVGGYLLNGSHGSGSVKMFCLVWVSILLAVCYSSEAAPLVGEAL